MGPALNSASLTKRIFSITILKLQAKSVSNLVITYLLEVATMGDPTDLKLRMMPASFSYTDLLWTMGIWTLFYCILLVKTSLLKIWNIPNGFLLTTHVWGQPVHRVPVEAQGKTIFLLLWRLSIPFAFILPRNTHTC